MILVTSTVLSEIDVTNKRFNDLFYSASVLCVAREPRTSFVDTLGTVNPMEFPNNTTPRVMSTPATSGTRIEVHGVEPCGRLENVETRMY